ncbi:hypothetical protein [Spiroplasma endosymbiont of Danaus chrysippus]|uniref:hypothetical protein n=1 Tax=Spiroplasma endosymbiont of Danaus chrysippus TaxID=2691041 RepID=UPI00157A6FF5|nr:hypothetical protein [Spiroplasma endosymbiont of Danaus chrysippus]
MNKDKINLINKDFLREQLFSWEKDIENRFDDLVIGTSEYFLEVGKLSAFKDILNLVRETQIWDK